MGVTGSKPERQEDRSHMNVQGDSHLTGLDEAQLEARAREGDRRACGRLLDLVRDELVRFCYRYLGNLDEAEDAVQDVLAAMVDRAWPAGNYRAYLFRAARNRCLDLAKPRRGGQVGSFVLDSRLQSPNTGPRTAALRKEEQEQLQQHFAALSRNHAEILALRYLDGMPRREIAKILEIPPSLVKSRLREAMKALDKLVNGTRR